MTVEILWLKYFIPKTACIALIIITTSEVERVLLVSPRIPRCSPCKSGRAGPELSASMRAWAGLGTVVAEVVSASRNPQCHREVVRPQSPHTPHTHNNPHTIISTFSDKILWFSQPLNQYVWWTDPTDPGQQWSRPQDAAQRGPLLLQHVPLQSAAPAPWSCPSLTPRWHVPPSSLLPPPHPAPPADWSRLQTKVPFQNAKSGAKPERKIWNWWVHEETFQRRRGKRQSWRVGEKRLTEFCLPWQCSVREKTISIMSYTNVRILIKTQPAEFLISRVAVMAESSSPSLQPF